MTACLAFMSLMYWNFSKNSLASKIFALLGFVVGVIAVFSSLSRGSWLTIPALVAVFTLYLFLTSSKKTQIIQVLAIITVGAAAAAWYAKDNIAHRVDLAISEVVSYYEGGEYKTSVGYRLELYKGSIEVIKHYPVLGVGLGAEMGAIAEMAEKDLVRPMPNMMNVHNQILQEGVAKGVLGILSYFVLMGYLLKIFLYGMLRSEEYREIHTAGVMLIVGYFVIGLTNITFTHGVFNTFFVVMVALLLGVNGLLDDYKRIMSSSSK